MQLKKGSPLLGYGLGVLTLHVLGICLLMFSAPRHPLLVGLGFLAYTFGLRHAFDVDHIAAIDNTIRKLRQDNRPTMGVGFYFSLGHSTVVFIMAIVTTSAVQWAQRTIPGLQSIGGIVGTIVSATFLFIIGIVNLTVLLNLYGALKVMRHGSFNETELEKLLQARGLLARFLSPLLRLVQHSWNVYPIGFLFGLGFDTASEVALLAISVGAAKNASPFSGIVALPVLFAAGMSLMDTADGAFMTSAYDWAFASPIRKVYYNLTVTGLSVLAALFIGLLEVVQVMLPALGLKHGFWRWVEHVNFGVLGIALVSMFIIAWTISFGIWKLFKVEQRWSSTN